MRCYMDGDLSQIVQEANVIIVLKDCLQHPSFYSQWQQFECLLIENKKKLLVIKEDLEALRQVAKKGRKNPLREEELRFIYRKLQQASDPTSPSFVEILQLWGTSPSNEHPASPTFSTLIYNLFKKYSRVCVFTQDTEKKDFLLAYFRELSKSKHKKEHANSQLFVHSFIPIVEELYIPSISRTIPIYSDGYELRCLGGATTRVTKKIHDSTIASFYEVSSPKYIAKIYHDPLDCNIQDKIKAMAQIHPTPSNIAYPAKAILNSENQIIGTLLLRFNGEPLQSVFESDNTFSNAHYFCAYSSLTIQFLVRVARSVTRQIHDLHNLGFVIGNLTLDNVRLDFPKDAKEKIATWIIGIDESQFNAYPRLVIQQNTSLHTRILQLDPAPLKSAQDDYQALASLLFTILMQGIPPQKVFPKHTNHKPSTIAVTSYQPPISREKWERLPAKIRETFLNIFLASDNSVNIPSPSEWITLLNTPLPPTKKLLPQQSEPGSGYLHEENLKGTYNPDFKRDQD